MKLKENYSFQCPKCGAKLTASPSIGMRMGINSGHGSCLNTNCNEFFHLKLNEDNSEMIPTLWDDHVNQVREEMKHEEL